MKNVLCRTSIIILCLFSGCVSEQYTGRSFPPVSSITLIPFGGKLPSDAVYIGRGSASGDFPAVESKDLIGHLRNIGMKNGADIMLIAGSRIVDSGPAADSAEVNFINETDAPDQASAEVNLDEMISGRSPNRKTFRRIMYASYYKKDIK